MGLFDKLFGKKASPEVIQECVRRAGAFSAATCKVTAGKFPEMDSNRLDYLTLFTFGGIHVLAQKNKLQLPEAHAVAIATFIQHLGFSAQDAAVKAQGCISAAGPDGYPNLKAIIHKGIDGFVAWESDPDSYSAKEFCEVLDAFSKAAKGE